MPVPGIHENDIGTLFVIQVADAGVIVNLATATLMKIRFRKPDGVLLEKTATLYTDGSDGKMVSDSDAGDLTPPGYWKLQGYVEFGTDRKWTGQSYEFLVHENI